MNTGIRVPVYHKIQIQNSTECFVWKFASSTDVGTVHCTVVRVISTEYTGSTVIAIDCMYIAYKVLFSVIILKTEVCVCV